MFKDFSLSVEPVFNDFWTVKNKDEQSRTTAIITESGDINQTNPTLNGSLLPDLSVIKTFLTTHSNGVYFSHVRFLNFYLPAAIRSRIKDLLPALSYKQRQKLCLCYVISTHIKTFDKSCFARKSILMDEYNAVFPSFGLNRGIKKSTFDTILKSCYESGLVKNIATTMDALTFHYRQLVINFDTFKDEYGCAFNLAVANAKKKSNSINIATYQQKIRTVDNSGKTEVKTGIIKKIVSKLGSGRSAAKRCHLSIKNIELVESEFLKVGHIREKRTSKEVRNKILKRSTNNKFDFSCFNQDSKLASELQTKARGKTATNKDLSDLLCLHIMHNVRISKAWHKFLRRLAYANQFKSDFEEKAGDIFLKAFPLAI